MASTYITRVDTTNGNRKVWTWSAWVKRDVLGVVEHNMFSAGGNNVDEGQFKFSSDQLSFFNDYATTGRVSATQPSKKFRDTNGWYHFVWRHKVDETSNDDRWKIYINGERLQPSDYGSPTIPNEEGVYNRFTNKQMWFGARAKAQYDSSYQYFSGLMSHIHFCDGYAYDASDFGETDATTGEWKIKTSPNVQYGSKGFFILKDGNSVTDQSGNGNNCTVAGGTLTKTEDCPSNVFATWNTLANTGLSLQNGNTYTVYASNDHNCKTTLGMNSGKYYWEMKPNGVSGTVTGICRDTTKQQADISNTSGEHVYAMQYNSGNVSYKTNGTFTASSSWGTYVSGDIIQYAYDADNGKLFIGKNGTYKDFSGNTGDPANGTYPTFSSLDTNATWFPFIEMRGGSENNYWNFGNGYFGTTAVSSAGTNASGIGIFEYDVPTGYTALSTKGLNE